MSFVFSIFSNHADHFQGAPLYLIAHSTRDGRFQPFVTHAKNVAKLSAAFAAEFSSDKQAFSLGLLHGDGCAKPADELQLCCQAMCLEQMLCCDIGEGFLYYHEIGCSRSPRRERGLEYLLP